MTDDLENLAERMRALDDKALHRIVSVEASDYRPEAVALARGEISRRGLLELTAEEYLTRYPTERLDDEGFCAACRDATEAGASRDFVLRSYLTYYPVGTRLFGGGERCPVCRSAAYSRWFCLGPLPLVPLGRYRAIAGELGVLQDRCVARRIRRP